MGLGRRQARVGSRRTVQHHRYRRSGKRTHHPSQRRREVRGFGGAGRAGVESVAVATRIVPQGIQRRGTDLSTRRPQNVNGETMKRLWLAMVVVTSAMMACSATCEAQVRGTIFGPGGGRSYPIAVSPPKNLSANTSA